MTDDDDPGGPVFDDWYCREFPRVRRAMTLATGDPLLGEEGAAEAFARALLHWRRVSAMDSPGGWVYATALNEVRRSWRRSALERRCAERLRSEDVPAPALPDSALWRAVADAVNLPELPDLGG